MADIGWITGHSYIVYGPLALAATSVIYEGVPNYPGRRAAVANRRAARRQHLPHLADGDPHAAQGRPGRAGEVQLPLQAHDHGGRAHRARRVAVVSRGRSARARRSSSTRGGRRKRAGSSARTKPALDPMKPGSAGPPALGIYPDHLSTKTARRSRAGSGKAGNICIRNPWPGIMQTIWGDRDRFVKQYYAKYCKNPNSKDWRDWPYFAADGAVHARGRLLPNPGPRRRRHQRRRAPAGHQGDRVGVSDGQGGRRGGGRAGRRRDQGPGAGRLCVAEARRRGREAASRKRSSRPSRR